MRILLVSHNLPPHGTAGTETYAADLARSLAARGHPVMAFAAQKDIGRRHLSLVRRDLGAVAVREVVNNLYHARFAATWDNPGVERVFARVLREHRPQVVHFQHLMYLSAGCVRLARESGARTVFTLHDFWLQCPRLGQRVHADGGICHEVVFARCGTCLPSFAWGQPRMARIAGPVIAALKQSTGIDLVDWARGMRRRSASARAPEPPATPAAARAPAAAAGPATIRADVLAVPIAPDATTAARFEAEARARWDGLRERVVPAVDLFLSPSRFLRERFVAEWGIDAARIEHLSFGVDPSAFRPARVPSPDGRVRVGFLGTLVPLKGPHLLLEAWGRIPLAARARGRLVLHGPARHGPGYQAELVRLAQAVGAELPGPLARERVPEFLASIDLLVVPSLWYENSPLVIQEALACGTPVAVSDLGGMAELVEPGRTGLRFPVGDASALARLLEGALAGGAGLERLLSRPVERPTFEQHVDRVLERYAGARTP